MTTTTATDNMDDTSANNKEGGKSLAAHEIAKIFPAQGPGIMSFDEYQKVHAESIADPNQYWTNEALQRLDWFHPFSQPAMSSGDFNDASSAAGDVTWFAGGKLNMCYNAVDRHVKNGKGEAIAMIFEGDEPTDIRKITFIELQRKICQIANALLSEGGVQKGDVVTIYMPMIPELAMTMLACTRIGAIHSVVFAGFSAEALAQRMVAAKSPVLITADAGKRAGKVVPLKDICNAARQKLPQVEEYLKKVLVWEREYNPATAHDEEGNVKTAPTYVMQDKDVRMDPLVARQRPYQPPVWMDAEDALFILYTSGSTGKPKGLVHTTGGYAVYAAATAQVTFGLESGKSIFACVADCGWITGHSYVVYGPLLNAVTTFLFESTPVYPDPGRYWDMVQRHKITQFYTAPTAIRLLMRYGDDHPQKYDLSSLTVLGSVGEPINPEAWRWYYEVVGQKRATVVDTYWQTETGGHVITNLPGITPMKPGSCTLPSFGIATAVLDPLTGKALDDSAADEHGNVTGVMAISKPWPGMARTCLDDHERFLSTYLNVYKGFYFTGDSVIRDKDGFHWIVGRVDDVLNVSGHRIGTAEVESALVAHAAVAQAAVVGQAHEIKGQSICAFCMLIEGAVYEDEEHLKKELRTLVRQEIGGFASPDRIVITPSLPMTRSGKIMRRILRKIVHNEIDQLGDTSTLADPSIVQVLIDKCQE